MTDRDLIARALGRYMTGDVANLAAHDILAALADDGAFTSSAAIWKSIAEDHRAKLKVARDEHEAAVTTARREGMERAAVIADEFRHGNPSPTVYGAIARAIRADKGDGE